MKASEALHMIGFGGIVAESTSFDVTIVTTSVDETFTLPLVSGYTYDAEVDWGDNSSSEITAWDDADKTHTYSVDGTYKIKITGDCPAWSFGLGTGGDRDKVTKVHFGSGVIFDYLEFGFRYCTELTDVTGGIYGSVNLTTLADMFESASNLTNIASGLFDNCLYVTDFTQCFNQTVLNSIPEGLFDNNTLAENMLGIFSYTNITSIPEGLFDNNTLVTNFFNTFASTNITSIPEGLFDNNTLATNFLRCFNFCDSLLGIPSGLLDNNDQVTDLNNMFAGCTSLTGSSGELWLNPSGASNYTLTPPDYDSGVPDGENCYINCTGLTDYASIPTYWK